MKPYIFFVILFVNKDLYIYFLMSKQIDYNLTSGPVFEGQVKLTIPVFYCPVELDNVFLPKTLEKQCAKNKAVKKDIDEWICRAESME